MTEHSLFFSSAREEHRIYIYLHCNTQLWFWDIAIAGKEVKGVEGKIQLHLEFLFLLLSGGVPYYGFGFIYSLKSMKWLDKPSAIHAVQGGR